MRTGEVWLGIFAAGWVALASAPAPAYDLYTGVRGEDGQLCCGGSDCKPVIVRPTKGGARFLVPDASGAKKWVEVPGALITYRGVPGEEETLAKLPPAPPGTQYGHICGYFTGQIAGDPRWFDGFHVYCAFVTPGGV